MSLSVRSLTTLAPVIPVVVVDDVADAVPLAQALVDGGLPAVEVTLRTAAAVPAIVAITAEVPGAVVGAGTVTSPAQIEAARDAGARFLVSPGSPRRLLDALLSSDLPVLPGVATATEAMAVLESGLTTAKLFPAEAVGGVALVRALAGPLPGLRLCPTGGIDQERARAYLAEPTVACVGGSWMLPADAVRAGDWARIGALARAAARLGTAGPPTAPWPAAPPAPLPAG